VNFVNQGRRRLFDQVLVPIRSRYGAGELARVENCLRVYLGERAPPYTDPRQRPSQMYFPDLPASPYFDRKLFGWADALEGQTAAIREELAAVLSEQRGREAVFHTEELARQNLRGGAAPPKWEGFYFYRHGERREDNCSRCPATDRALQMAPLMQVRDLGPEVMFSVLSPALICCRTEVSPMPGSSRTFH